MNKPVFESILDQYVDDVKPPPLLPQGTYHTVVVGLPEFGLSSKKQTEFYKFTHRIVAPVDVDETILSENFPEGVAGIEIDNTYYITPKSLFMLTDFIKNCLGVESVGKKIPACIDMLPNSEVLIYIKHEPNDDGTRFFARVGRTAPVE